MDARQHAARPPSARGAGRSRPRIGVVKFASCDGCQLTLLDLEDELLALDRAVRVRRVRRGHLASLVRAVRRPASSRARSARPEQAEEIVRLRAVTHDASSTIGACATAGGIQALRNCVRARRRSAPRSTPQPAFVESLAPGLAGRRATSPSTRELRGCPIDARPAASSSSPPLATGRRPQLPGRGRLPRVQAARRRVRRRRPGRALPRARHPDRAAARSARPMGAAATAASGRAKARTRRRSPAWYVAGPTDRARRATSAACSPASPALVAAVPRITDRLGGRPAARSPATRTRRSSSTRRRRPGR